MTMKDQEIEYLVELDGNKYVIDEVLGLWVKFEVKRVEATEDTPHGIRYSFTLHDLQILGSWALITLMQLSMVGREMSRQRRHMIIGIEMIQMKVDPIFIKMQQS